MFCPKCGNDVRPGARFCGVCGNDLSDVGRPEPAPHPRTGGRTASGSRPALRVSSGPAPATGGRRSKRLTYVLGGLAIVLAVVAVVIIVRMTACAPTSSPERVYLSYADVVESASDHFGAMDGLEPGGDDPYRYCLMDVGGTHDPELLLAARYPEEGEGETWLVFPYQYDPAQDMAVMLEGQALRVDSLDKLTDVGGVLFVTETNKDEPSKAMADGATLQLVEVDDDEKEREESGEPLEFVLSDDISGLDEWYQDETGKQDLPERE